MLLCWPPTWHAVRVVIILSLNTEGGSKTQQLWRHTNHPSVHCTLIIYYETSLVRSSQKNVCTNGRTTLDWNWMNTDLNLRSPRRWYSWISALLSSSESFFRQNTKTGYTGYIIKLEGNMIWLLINLVYIILFIFSFAVCTKCVRRAVFQWCFKELLWLWMRTQQDGDFGDVPNLWYL